MTQRTQVARARGNPREGNGCGLRAGAQAGPVPDPRLVRLLRFEEGELERDALPALRARSQSDAGLLQNLGGLSEGLGDTAFEDFLGLYLTRENEGLF